MTRKKTITKEPVQVSSEVKPKILGTDGLPTMQSQKEAPKIIV